MRPDLRIENMDHVPFAAPILAAWHVEAFSEWLGGWTVPDCLAELRTHGPAGTVPFTLVALRGDEVLGSISLIRDDPPAPAHLGPWLASFLVREDIRGRGIGSLLHNRLLATAAAAGWQEIFLWTPGASAWYGARGWTAVSRFEAHGRESLIMRVETGPNRVSRPSFPG